MKINPKISDRKVGHQHVQAIDKREKKLTFENLFHFTSNRK